MDKSTLRQNIAAAVNEYVATPEAWEDAQLTVDPDNGDVDIVEIEEADNLDDRIDVYPMMDFVEMTPDGEWIPDEEAIDSVVNE